MKKTILFGMLILIAVAVYSYTEGQEVSQTAIDNYDVDITFNELWQDLECEKVHNPTLMNDTFNRTYYYYQVDCWDLEQRTGGYFITRRTYDYSLYKDDFKEGLSEECGYPADAECKQRYIDYVKDKLKTKFVNWISEFLEKIARWKSADDVSPEDLGLDL